MVFADPVLEARWCRFRNIDPIPFHLHLDVLRINSPVYDCRWRRTLFHIGLPRSCSNSCYHHQDRHWQPVWLALGPSPRRPSCPPTRSALDWTCALWWGMGGDAWVPSIFRAGRCSRRVVTHFLAGADFRGHCPAVWSDRHLSVRSDERQLGHLSPCVRLIKPFFCLNLLL